MQASPSLPPAPAAAPDFLVENHGSVFLLRHRTPAARAWVWEHLPRDRQTWGDATIIEHRYICDIVAGAQAAGLVVA
jgi:hypothetical protein